MELNGQRPDKGPIVVTGATGGVGSVAVSMLAARGYRVIAVLGPARARRLPAPPRGGRGRGAGRARSWAPARSRRRATAVSIDNVGGELLAGLVRHVGLWGQVACIGMASSPDLATSVFPLILRGVSLLGVSSGNCPMPLRHEVWTRLGARPQAPAARRHRVAGGPARRGDRDGASPDRAARPRPDPGGLLKSSSRSVFRGASHDPVRRSWVGVGLVPGGGARPRVRRWRTRSGRRTASSRG